LVGDHLAKELPRFKKLKRLILMDTRITDAALAHIGRLDSLVELNLYGTRISDAELEQLSGLKNLTRLELGYTRATERGRATLQRSLPDCYITIW
jgi:hypothetical protein